MALSKIDSNLLSLTTDLTMTGTTPTLTIGDAGAEDTKIVFDGNEYAADDLSQKAKNILGFLKRADEELAELRYSLDKVNLARKQAIADLSGALKEKESE